MTGFTILVFALSSYSAFGRGLQGHISLAHSIGAFAVAVAAYFARKLTLPRVIAAEFVLIGPFFAEIWLRHTVLTEAGAPFPPFQGLKLVVLALAVIVPTPVWVHLVWVAGFAVLSAVIWIQFEFERLPNQYLADEPWFTVVFLVASVGLLLYRWHSEVLTRRLMAAEARSRAFASVARLFLRMRDETNTPLQNLRLGIELLAQRHPEATDIIARLRSAVDRIEVTRGTLGRYDHLINWNGSELHADPELESLLVELEHEAARAA